MSEKKPQSTKAYHSQTFLNSKDARVLRILSEYLEPQSRFAQHHIEDTIVFMGSARIIPPAERNLMRGTDSGESELSSYYEAARELARKLTTWSMALDSGHKRFVVCTGGGPGIMEAANRGAADAGGVSIGLTISIPIEQFDNLYLTPDLGVHFHYFFMRKFWFAYLAKAVIVFPGGYGTMDELFEILTLVQTGKMRKPLPIVLFGTRFWEEVINFDALARYGTIGAKDVKLMFRTDSVDEAYNWIVAQLVSAKAVGHPGPTL